MRNVSKVTEFDKSIPICDFVSVSVIPNQWLSAIRPVVLTGKRDESSVALR